MKSIQITTLLVCAAFWSCSPPTSKQFAQTSVFQHGVASGDPLNDRVIIWTKVSPPDSISSVEVDWEMATDSAFDGILKYGKVTTMADRDFTVKVDVKGLNPGTKYHYRFRALDETSIHGQTKTASGYTDSLVFAVVSCSNYESGYFNAYGRIADREDLDAVIHLGDYIYEYGIRPNADPTMSRLHDPSTEIISLKDYRTRYAQYRTDEDLMRAHAAHPFIVIWDDHEIANNSYKSGAQNHQEEEGSYEERKAAAKKAYYEWMPIRDGRQLYRKFSFGKMADVLMLDERLVGREKQLESMQDPDYENEERSMLGEEQFNWLTSQLKSSSAQWKIIGNQVIFSDLNRSLVFPDRPKNMDSWDGYPVEKRAIAKTIVENNIENILWITGDTHSSWAFNTMVEGVSDEPFAVEFGVTSVSSTNYDERTSMDTVRMAEELFLNGNPHLRYTNLADHGYVLLTLTSEQAKAAYYFVDTVKERSDLENLKYVGYVKAGVSIITTE